VSLRLQTRRMRRLPDPHAAPAQESERRKLQRILLVNAATDVGYVALGVKMAGDSRSRVSGAGWPSSCRARSCFCTTASTLSAAPRTARSRDQQSGKQQREGAA